MHRHHTPVITCLQCNDFLTIQVLYKYHFVKKIIFSLMAFKREVFWIIAFLLWEDRDREVENN